MSWYTKITQDLSNLPDFIQHYEHELSVAKYNTHIQGNIEKNLSELPGITEQQFRNLQEIEVLGGLR